MAGFFGHTLLLIALVTCAMAGWFFFKAARIDSKRDDATRKKFMRRARQSWVISMGAILGASALLMYLIFTHQFQYNYVYSYTSLDLDWFYTLSAFWAGQEGSFTLWILINGLVGVALIRWARNFEAPVMAILAFCQLFLISMVAEINFGFMKIGASPFLMLADKYPTAEVLQQPGFVPADGEGLNDLLQNFWMVIHPPVLFAGFSMMAVPFAYAIAGLWKKRYTEWVRPALPWALAANFALMAGIALGAYWAYETLSFGGYWAWDPVENSSLVPWLVGVAALHTMISQKKSGANYRAAFLLNIFAYLLIIYSTFLTRSGILGDMSVHSFVDLGLYGQLVVWIVAVSALGFGLYVRRQRDLPRPQRETNFLSREFMIFLGAMMLCAVGAVILVGTSSPLVGKLFQDSPSAVATTFYNEWSMPIMAVVIFLAGLGQLFWWQKMTREQVNTVLFRPMLFATLSTAVVLLFTPFVEGVMSTTIAQVHGATDGSLSAGIGATFGQFWNTYGNGLMLVLLVFSCFFALYGNGFVLWRIGKGNPRMAGGAIAHVGLLLMLFGIVATGFFGNALSDRPARAGEREVFVIDQGQTRLVEGYQVSYLGQEPLKKSRTAYRLRFVSPQGRRFEVAPVAYQNDRGQWVQHPDTKSFVDKDLYVAISPRQMFEKGDETGPGEIDITKGDSVVVGDGAYRIAFRGFDLNVDNPAVPDTARIVVASVLDVTNLQTGERQTLRPIYYMIGDHDVEHVAAQAPDWGISITLAGMQVDGSAIRLGLDGINVEQQDWVVVQAYEKPFINLLWLGTIVMLVGFVISTYRRLGDEKRSIRRRETRT